jgi:serine phosphatase RsbU (regulator of sigma subunit)
MERTRLLQNLSGALLSLPLALFALIVLFLETDWGLLWDQWLLFLLFLVFGLLLNRLAFFQITGHEDGSLSHDVSTLVSLPSVAAVLLLGPTAIWLPVLYDLFYQATIWPRSQTRIQRWSWLRNVLFNLWSNILSLLIALELYQWLGGRIPLPDLLWPSVWPALVAVVALLALRALFFAILGVFWYIFVLPQTDRSQPGSGQRLAYTLRFLVLSDIPAFFGILAAGVYSSMGWGALLFVLVSALLASWLARRLSLAVMTSQQRTQEVTQLELLGRAIIAAPGDASTLPELLALHVPKMFDFVALEIRLYPQRVLLRSPQDGIGPGETTWQWLHQHPEPIYVPAGEGMPGTDQISPHALFAAPIMSKQSAQPLGGICLIQERRFFTSMSSEVLPALQALADQIATALQSAEAYRDNLAHQRVAQELALAGQIQASFLPDTLPQLPGWQVTATVQPARETSGDFYDAIPLPNGQLAILVGDVADKGVGAALYMALSRTLLRTYAYEYHTRPDYVLQVTNRRILADAQAGLFISVFYGVIDPYRGTLTYCNAGHNPPLLFRNHGVDKVQRLERTGTVLGIMEDVNWNTASLVVHPGDLLVLYSDGVVDAQDTQGGFFDEPRLQSIVAESRTLSPLQIRDGVLTAVNQFMGSAPQFDDMTVMVVARDQA